MTDGNPERNGVAPDAASVERMRRYLEERALRADERDRVADERDRIAAGRTAAGIARLEAGLAREDVARHRDGSDLEYEMARSELERANGGDNRRGA